MNIILILIVVLVVYVVIYNMNVKQNIYENFVGMAPVLGSIEPADKSAYINKSPADTAKVNTYNMPYQKPKLDGTAELKQLINGKEAVRLHNQYNLLNDPLFRDVIYYENDMKTGQVGINSCVEKCSGNCVEYGQTGNAYCFPTMVKAIQ